MFIKLICWFGKTEDYILITRGVDLIKTMAKKRCE